MLFKLKVNTTKAEHEIHYLRYLLSEICNSCDRQNVNFKLCFQPQQELFDLRGLVQASTQEKTHTHTHTNNLSNWSMQRNFAVNCVNTGEW